MPKALLEQILKDIIHRSGLNDGLREGENSVTGEWNGRTYRIFIFIEKY